MSDESPQPVDGEQAADADLAAGRYQEYADLDALVADLDGRDAQAPAEQADEPADRGTPVPPPRRAGSRRVPKIMIRQPEDTL